MINWTSSNEFTFNGVDFTIDLTPGKNRRQSTSNNFTLVKTRRFIKRYLELYHNSGDKVKNILELGIFQGGGFAFLNELFEPNKIVGVEISKVPLPALDEYIAKLGKGAKVYYGTSQDDTKKLHDIYVNDFDSRLDMVVDDASHLYEFTKASFEFLFPLLKPNGIYVIEDWAWSFRPGHQKPNNPWYNKIALSNLIIECFEEVIANTVIDKMTIYEQFAVIHKSGGKQEPKKLFSETRRRGRVIEKL